MAKTKKNNKLNVVEANCLTLFLKLLNFINVSLYIIAI